MDTPTVDVKIVNLTSRLEYLGDLHAHLRRDTTLLGLIRGKAHTKHKIFADALTHRGKNIGGQPHPAFQMFPPVSPVQIIGQRRDELVQQMAMSHDLNPVHTACFHPLRRIGKIRDYTRDIPVFRQFWEGMMRRLAVAGRRHRRQPVALVPMGATPQVGELDHHRRAVVMHLIGHVADPGHHLVLVGEDIVEHRRAVARHRRRARRHGQRHPGLGPFCVIGRVALFWHALFGIGWFMAGGHNPIAQGQVFQCVGLQKRVVGHRVFFLG